MAVIKYRQTLQAAIDSAASGDLEVDLAGGTVWVKGRIDWRSGVNVKHGTIKFEDAAHLVHGDGTGMEDITIESRQGNLSADGVTQNPVVEIVNGRDNIFRRITVNGDNPRTAFLCKTRAYNVLAEDVTIAGNLGYGWLYDDGINERKNPNYRVFDGEDYAGEPLGVGATLRRFQYGHAGQKNPGDGIEFNAPMCGFRDVLIEDPVITRAVKGDNKGLGIAGANCTGVRIYRAIVKNAERSGIHFEKGGDHLVDGFDITGGGRAISIGHTAGTIFRNGSCTDNEQWLTSYNTLDPDLFGPATGLVFENVVLKGATKDGILISNAESYLLRNLEVTDYMGVDDAIFMFYQEDPAGIRQGVTKSRIDRVVFSKGQQGIVPAALISISKSPNNEVTNVFSPDLPRKIRIEGNLIHF
ncbi:hypothetical protein [Paenibacillus kandeliae]|uniref:hypothetical protein n=1 Tax=Paenibacillus kandeliae TaxID=3231269 RepID=UPI00345AB24A